MKKLVVAVAVLLVIGGGAFFFLKKSDNDEMNGATPTSGNTNTTPPPSSASVTYKDGSYTSPVVQTDRGYGPIQVKAIISGGKLTDVVFLQMPSMPGHTTEVTAMAEPILKQEAIAAQNAQVDIVSGATQDTQAFQQALASALAMAK